jgi:hypothetical protein
MPAVTSDTIALPRVARPGLEAAERRVVSVTTAPSGLEGEGFPVRRAFAGVDLATLHQDSNGGGGLITDGDTQWMTAGAG